MTRKSMIWVSAALVVAGLGFVGSETASAAWGVGYGYQSNGYGHQSYGNPGYGYQNYGFQQNRGFAQPGYNNYNNYGGYRSGQYGNSSTHFDYVPPTITQHGNHLDRTPGHFDLHRGGHYYRH